MYRGKVKAVILSGRKKPEMSAELSGKAYTKGTEFTFDKIINSHNVLWAKTDEDYVLLADNDKFYIDYEKYTKNEFGIGSIDDNIDKNEIPYVFSPSNTIRFRDSQIAKSRKRLEDYFGESDSVKEQYRIWYSSQLEIGWEDVVGFENIDYVIAINEIYARHGKRFNTTWIQDYFNSLSWYSVSNTYDYENEESNLSTLEIHNIKFLKQVESGIMTMPKYQSGIAMFAAEVGESDSSVDEDKHDEYVIWYSSDRLLTTDDLDWMQEDAATCLMWARNEIYARHGREFKTASLQAYFNSKSWYKINPNYNYKNENQELSAIELANVRFILAYEKGEVEHGSPKTAADYLDTQGIMIEYVNDLFSYDYDEDLFRYYTDGIQSGNYEYFRNDENREKVINGVTYKFEVDSTQEFEFNGHTTYGIGVTNTVSGEYYILGPGGTVYSKEESGKVVLDLSSAPKNWIKENEDGSITVTELISDDEISPLDAYLYRQDDPEADRINTEIERTALDDFLNNNGTIQDYVKTFETTRKDKATIRQNMRLFGCPYQFTEQVDPRISDVSSTIGRKFYQNIMSEAPVVTIIPGIPKYLGTNNKDKQKSTTIAFMDASSDNFGALKALINNNPSKYMRYYDFQAAYIDYMKYVNILCRTCASFLEITDELDGIPLTQFDWRDYRSDSDQYHSTVGKVTQNLGSLLKNAGYDAGSKVKKTVSLMSDGTINIAKKIFGADGKEISKAEEDPEKTSSNNNGTSNNGSSANSNSGTSSNDKSTVTDSSNDKTNNATGSDTANSSSSSSTKEEATEVSKWETEIPVYDAASGVFNHTGGTTVSFDENGNPTESSYDGTGMVYATTTDESEDFESIIESLMMTQNFVQFMVDPDISVSESMSNSTSESQFKSLFDTASSKLKELAFLMQSGGADASSFQDWADNSLDSLSAFIDKSSNNSVSTILSRLITVGGNIVKGENIIMPDIYQSSQYQKSYSITIHLKAEAGDKLSFLMDVLVPLMHLVALVLPRQTTANTYGSPFLIKAFVEGSFTCNLGMVSNLTINKSASSESWTIEGLPNEIDVTLDITDLYSDLTMSPQNDPRLFLSNSSLIEFLATACGLSLVRPQILTKYQMIVNTVKNSIKDIPENVKSSITEKVDNLFQTIFGLY